MTDFNFKVGDKVRLPNWPDDQFVTIKEIGSGPCFWDGELAHWMEDGWQPYTPPPKRYVVEFRRPATGERYVDSFGHVHVASASTWCIWPVIVSEVTE